MKRRDFFTSVPAGLLVGMETSHALADSVSENNWPCIARSDDSETAVSIPGLKETITVLQIADSHLSCDENGDAEFLSYSKRMGGGTVTKNRFEHFDRMLRKAKDEKADLVALTGDIVNYPSETAVRRVRAMLEESGQAYLYTAGNHDWHYEGMEGSERELRKIWIEKRLKPLYRGADPMCSSTVVKGVNFVCIDDSTYVIEQHQLEFYLEQKSRPEPVVLLMHIPLYMPSMSIFSCGHPKWGAATDPYFEIERRPRWPETGCGETTRQFVREVLSTPRLAGIFTGHTHRATTIASRSGIQHIAPAALNGLYRLIRFRPLEE